MAKALTTKAVEAAKAGTSRREIPDGLVVGLYLVVQPSGAKSWAIRYRAAGRPKKLTLGPLAPSLPGVEPKPVLGAPLTLAGARALGRLMLQQVAAGIDPAAEKKAARAPENIAKNTVEAVVADWLKRDQSKNRTYADVARAMENNVVEAWRGRAIQSITRRDALDLIDAVHDRAPVMALRLHAYLHRLFKWAVGRGIVEASPMADLPKPGREISRDRVLSDEELRAVWTAAEAMAGPFGRIVQLLILTGARKLEIGEVRWSEINADARLILLGADRTKTAEARTIPLSPRAVGIIETVPRLARCDFVFSTNGRTAVSGYSKAKSRLDALIVERAREAAEKAGEDPDQVQPLPAWRLHDLRRTVATGLQRLGQRLEVIEAVLGHVSGSRAGVVGIYQRHQFEDEKRAALETWARHVEGLLEPQPENVIELRGRA